MFLRSRPMRGALFGKNSTFFSENVSGIHGFPLKACGNDNEGLKDYGTFNDSQAGE